MTVFLTVLEDGFIIPDDVSFDPLVSGADPYEFLEGQPIDLKRYFHDRALENVDEFGRMFGDRDFRGGMVASHVADLGHDCAYLVVEAVAYEHNITVQLASSLDELCGISAQSWVVEMADGRDLPEWMDWQSGSDFMQVTRPLDVDTLKLRIRALLDNGRNAVTSVEIDLATGSVIEIGQAFSQSQTLSEQLVLETKRLSEGADALLKTLAS